MRGVYLLETWIGADRLECKVVCIENARFKSLRGMCIA
jgi:hypothetical protein